MYKGRVIIMGAAGVWLLVGIGLIVTSSGGPEGTANAQQASRPLLSSNFNYKVLATTAEAPLNLRFFTTAVKTDSRGRIITGPNSDPIKIIIGPEPAGERGG